MLILLDIRIPDNLALGTIVFSNKTDQILKLIIPSAVVVNIDFDITNFSCFLFYFSQGQYLILSCTSPFLQIFDFFSDHLR